MIYLSWKVYKSIVPPHQNIIENTTNTLQRLSPHLSFIICTHLLIIVTFNINLANPNEDVRLYNDLDSLAQCITKSGMIFYGSSHCGHCQRQKAKFGDAMEYINYVECPLNQELCTNVGIQALPTWILIDPVTKIEKSRHEGVKTLKELAELSNCLPLESTSE
jgi:hypothetical protein